MSIVARRMQNAYGQASLAASVEAASPHKLIVMLFEGAIKSVSLAKIHMQNGSVAEKGASVSKAIAIIEEGLRLSLDRESGGELAENLDALYDYMARQLLEANIHNKQELLDEVLKLLVDIKEAWEGIDPTIQAQSSQIGQQPLVRGHV